MVMKVKKYAIDSSKDLRKSLARSRTVVISPLGGRNPLKNGR